MTRVWQPVNISRMRTKPTDRRRTACHGLSGSPYRASVSDPPSPRGCGSGNVAAEPVVSGNIRVRSPHRSANRFRRFFCGLNADFSWETENKGLLN